MGEVGLKPKQLSSEARLLKLCTWYSEASAREALVLWWKARPGAKTPKKGSGFIKKHGEGQSMESFLEIKHMLLTSYSNGFAPRDCQVTELQLG